MTRLIDADNVLKALNVFRDRENGNNEFLKGISSAKEIVENEPTVPSFGQWISVEDRLPHDGDPIIYCTIYSNACEIWCGVYSLSDNAVININVNGDVSEDKFDYWMPLPDR